MSVRKRTWAATDGTKRQAWIVDWRDPDGKRRHRQFRTKGEAEAFRYGTGGEMGRPSASYSFASPLPKSRKRDGRQAIVDALLAAYPRITPTSCPIIVHATAECVPSAVVCDVDNLLKPVLDALAGHVYINDTQVIECLARKVISARNRLLVRAWVLPPISR